MDEVEGLPGIQVELDLSDPRLPPMVKLQFPNVRSDWMLSKSCAVWLATELLKAVQQIPEKNFFEKADTLERVQSDSACKTVYVKCDNYWP